MWQSQKLQKKIVIKQSNTLEKIMATYKNGRYFCTMNTCKSTQSPSGRGSKEYKQKTQITNNEMERYT